MFNQLKTGIATAMVVSCMSCAVWVNSPDPDLSEDTTDKKVYRTIFTGGYFPFENNQNWWSFTEDGGNKLSVRVTDTISDDNTIYYRISFQEHRVDTTDDWFKRSGGEVLFGSSLTGTYRRFLPGRLEIVKGRIDSPDSNITYTYYDSLLVNMAIYHNILRMTFNVPFIHGFEEIWVADKVGIIIMKDTNGRWPVVYSLDSCRVFR